MTKESLDVLCFFLEVRNGQMTMKLMKFMGILYISLTEWQKIIVTAGWWIANKEKFNLEDKDYLGCLESRKAHSKYKQTLETFAVWDSLWVLESTGILKHPMNQNFYWVKYRHSISTHHNALHCCGSESVWRHQQPINRAPAASSLKNRKRKEFSKSKVFGKKKWQTKALKKRRHHGSRSLNTPNWKIFASLDFGHHGQPFDPSVPHKWTGPPWTNDLLPGGRLLFEP